MIYPSADGKGNDNIDTPGKYIQTGDPQSGAASLGSRKKSTVNSRDPFPLHS
jgi:hypothetical protein